jgi:aryl sulfotransferase
MGGAPWIDTTRQLGIESRNDDVWISVPPKSGTNWMMNIVHQLVSGGDADFVSIYDVVHWPEFVERPGQPASELHERLASVPSGQRRIFKSHSAPSDLPFIAADGGQQVKYLVVCRNPEEALVSFKVFLEMHTDAFFDLWQVPKAALTRPSFEGFYREIAEPQGMHGMWFGFLAAWWPLRHAANVRFVHFADMKADLPGCVRSVAEFLSVTPSAEHQALVEECTSFAWMKRNEAKFDTFTRCSVPPLEVGALIRKGKAGAAHEDGMTPDIAREVREFGAKILPDTAAMRWLYEGGSLP